MGLRAMPDAKHRQATGGLRHAGLKATLPRLKVLEVFQRGPQRHFTADELYRALLSEHADIGFATVYRVLSQLEQAGLILRSSFQSDKSAVFELHDGPHHDHLVCVNCGRIEEFHDAAIEQRQVAVARERGFALREHALALYGDCNRKHCEHRPGGHQKIPP